MSNELYIMHYGVGHDKGGHSGRYPWGSGDNPRQDAKNLKKILKSNVTKAQKESKIIEGKDQLAVDFKSGNWTSISKSGVGPYGRWQREKLKEAIRDRYNNNPEFRANIKEAKKAWVKAGNEQLKLTKSFIDHYKSSNIESDRDIAKAKHFIDTYKNKINFHKDTDDVEFATRYMYDDHVGRHRIISIFGALLTAVATFATVTDR